MVHRASVMRDIRFFFSILCFNGILEAYCTSDPTEIVNFEEQFFFSLIYLYIYEIININKKFYDYSIFVLCFFYGIVPCHLCR